MIDETALKRDLQAFLAKTTAARKKRARAEGTVLTRDYWDGYRVGVTKVFAEDQMVMVAHEIDARHRDTAEDGVKAGKEFGAACATIAVALNLSCDDGEEAMHAARKRLFGEV